MTLSQTILELIKKYYNLGQTVRDTILMGQGTAKPVVRMQIQRTAIAWKIKNRDDDYDNELAEQLLEHERFRIAQQIFDLTNNCLKDADNELQLRLKDGRHNFQDHRTMMSWSIGMLIEMEIISPFEISYMSETQKDGITFGMKRKSMKPPTAEDEAEEELQSRMHET